MSTMATPDLGSTYGALLIGAFLVVFFQGVLTVQAYIYYESFPGDSKTLKVFVAILWILDLVHLLLVCDAVYRILIDGWSNPSAFWPAFKTLNLHIIFLGTATILCRGFFLYRVWTFTKRCWILTTSLAVPCLVAFALGIVVAVRIVNLEGPADSKFKIEVQCVLALLGIGAGVDVITAALLIRNLHQAVTPGRGARSTTFVAGRIIQYTAVTGLATSLLAVTCFVAYFSLPHSLISLACYFCFGRMYTNSLLAMLNSRRNLRAALEMLDEPTLETPFAGSQNELVFAPPVHHRTTTAEEDKGETIKDAFGVMCGTEKAGVNIPTGMPGFESR